jgi:hypothetical protein
MRTLTRKALVQALAGLAIISTVVDSAIAQTSRLKPLSLYWSSQTEDNFVTATQQGRNDAVDSCYSSVGVEACILTSQEEGSVPFNLYWSEQRGDNYTTATREGAARARDAGYVFVRTEGYVFPTQESGTIPLGATST